MKRNSILLLLFLLPWLLMAMSVDDVPNVHVADRTQYVSNPSGVLSPATVNRLNSEIAQLWENTSVELVVVAIDKVDSSTNPGDFATDLFEKWGIGKKDKDNGVLILLSRDDHEAQIRTGYGVEGALPDIVAGRIIRDTMIPYFREEDYDGGVAAGVERVITVLQDPSLRDELMSKYKNDSHAASDDNFSNQLWHAVVLFGEIVGGFMLILVVYTCIATRRMADVQRWNALDHYNIITLVLVFLTLGMALPAYIILRWQMHHVRRHRRNCPHCGNAMRLIDEEHDNDYLTQAQDTEEKLKSVDYDVWVCPNCHQTEILPYVNRSSAYTVCDRCGAKAMSLVDRRILRHPTTRSEGEGVDIYMCKNCGNQHNRPFKIERKPDPAAAAAAGAVLGSMIGGRGGGGGGFSGGSFGGGMTGGGGAGGSW